MNENPYEAASACRARLPASVTRVLLPFEFRGNGGEYFRIWIVNLLLTIVTLGIYSAWAKVRRLRYFYGNTFLDGQSFDYHGQPLAILKGRLIVVAGYVVFLVASHRVSRWARPSSRCCCDLRRAVDHHAVAQIPVAHDLVPQPALQLPWHLWRRHVVVHRLVLSGRASRSASCSRSGCASACSTRSTMPRTATSSSRFSPATAPTSGSAHHVRPRACRLRRGCS